MGDATAKREQPPYAILIGLMAPAVLTTLMLGIFAVVLPNIRQEFNVPADTAAWIVLSYSVPLVIMMPLYGRLGDAIEKRWLLMAGVTLFLVGTTTILVAPSLLWILAGRMFQGMGAASIQPLCIAFISQIFRSEERGKMLGTWHSISALAVGIAPYLGGSADPTVGMAVHSRPHVACGAAGLTRRSALCTVPRHFGETYRCWHESYASV